MNVTHVSDDSIPQPTENCDRLFNMFHRQIELMDKYHPIEDRNGFRVPDLPVNLDDRFDQARLKDFAWRVTEELTESSTAEHEDKQVQETHQIEEIADALHFLIELNIQVGWDSERCYRAVLTACGHEYKQVACRLDYMFFASATTTAIPTGKGYYRPIEFLGKAMNCLKNKPWKNSHMMTDKEEFYKNLALANAAFIRLCHNLGLTADSLYRIYYKKSEVNKFRQRSNY